MKLKNLFLPFVLLVLFVGATACQAAECPIRVERVEPAPNYVRLRITSMVDAVTIQGVTVNRGNMKIYGLEKELPKSLKFGEVWFVAPDGKTIIEVEVQTDQGTWTFKF